MSFADDLFSLPPVVDKSLDVEYRPDATGFLRLCCGIASTSRATNNSRLPRNILDS